MGSPTTKTVPNLIQGVSQQSAEQRRDSQCEAQFDCFNSPKDGVVARNGADLLRFLPGVDMATALTFEMFRGLSEHYLAVISKPGAPAATLRVFDYTTGIECTVGMLGSGAAYIDALSGFAPRDCFAVQTVDDYTFVANRLLPPTMAATVSSSRPKEALVFFRAGGYSMTTKITIVLAGTAYSWTYKTPDNSAPVNAQYITTSNLAATFYRAMTGVVAPTYSTDGVGAVVQGDPGASGGAGTIEPSVVVSAASTLAALGFSIEINSNLLRIWRVDGQDFLIDSSDGVGDTHVTVLKDNVRAFSELPKGGFPGFLLRVRGVSNAARTDYFVEYVNKGPADGYWQERTGPAVPTTLDPARMPHALINTGPGTFTFGPLTWSLRIAGDGVETSKDPGFVGRGIEALFYHKGRLGILTNATATWSKQGSPFTFFPDTVQTVLDDAPVDITLAAGEQIALLKRTLSVDEGLFLWAQRSQFRVNSGSEPFKQNTVDAPSAGAYEFAEYCNFGKIGASVYLATEPDSSVVIRNLQFANGKLAGDIDVTAHVSEYIPAGARLLSVSDTGQLLFVQTDGAYNSLFLYNFLVQDRQVVQSAWNQWRFPEGRIIRSSVYRDTLRLLFQRTGGVAMLALPLNQRGVDPGGAYRTRLDMRVDEDDCTTVYYPDTDISYITIPYPLSLQEQVNVRVVLRTSGGVEPDVRSRGTQFDVLGVLNDVVSVRGDLTPFEFYLGFRIESLREESTFYLRGPDGSVTVDELSLRDFRVNHAKSGYYRIEVEQGAGRSKVATLYPRVAGTSDVAIGGHPPLDTGTLTIGVDMENYDTRIRLVNDSPLPSRWQTSAYTYEATLRSKPSRVKAGEA